jgi:transposase
MENESQAVLFADVHLWRAPQPKTPPAGERPRLQVVNRNQLILRTVDVEQLIGPEHPARAVWELLGQRDLSKFYNQIEATEGSAGRPARDPRLLLSLWICAYMEGTPSAREIARQCACNAGFQWLTGATAVSAHALSDFRTEHEEGLKDLASQILGLLAGEGMVDLQQVTQDGTKVRASAGVDTFRREKTVKRHIEEARQLVEELAQGNPEDVSLLTLQARQRGARERLNRLEQAQQELEKIQRGVSEKEKSEVRVSLTDAECRIMKQGDGGYAPSFNLQIVTDVKNKVIVSAEVTQQGGDTGQLQPAMERLRQEAGRVPKQLIVDAGYTSRENIVATAKAGIDLIGPPLEAKVQKETLYQIRGVAPEYRPEAFTYDAEADAYTCPEGKRLGYKSRNTMVGQVKYTYTAEAAECGACAEKSRCCPTTKQGRLLVRSEDTEEVAAFRVKMGGEEAQTEYKKRGAVAEFVNLWIKEKLGLRRFSVRGLKKAGIEALWVTMTYNIQQWIRLRWRKPAAAAAAVA